MNTLQPSAEQRLAKQHALRVESHAVAIGHPVRDQSKASAARRQERVG